MTKWPITIVYKTKVVHLEVEASNMSQALIKAASLPQIRPALATEIRINIPSF